MSQLVGAPVRVQLMRWDEIGWDNSRPGDADGRPRRHRRQGQHRRASTSRSSIRSTRASTSDESPNCGHAAAPVGASGGTPPLPMYNIAEQPLPAEVVPLTGNWITADWMRAGRTAHDVRRRAGDRRACARGEHGSGRVPAAERHPGQRLARSNADVLAVLDAVTKAANWQPKVAASKLSDANVVTGRGVAWSNVYDTDAVHADGRDRRRRGEQEDRQGHGQARLPGVQRWPRRSIPAGSRTRSSAGSRRS